MEDEWRMNGESMEIDWFKLAGNAVELSKFLPQRREDAEIVFSAPLRLCGYIYVTVGENWP